MPRLNSCRQAQRNVSHRNRKPLILIALLPIVLMSSFISTAYTAGLRPEQSNNVGQSPRSAGAIGEVNEDDKLDLAVSTEIAATVGKVSLLFNSSHTAPDPTPPPTPASVYSISGHIANGSSGFTSVKLSGTQESTISLDGFDNYNFSNLPAGGTYTVTPYSNGSVVQYSFTPASQTFENLSGNQVADFTRVLATHTISGRVTNTDGVGLGGISIYANPLSGLKTLTDSNGNYSFALSAGQGYLVSAGGAHYSFTPESVTINRLDQDITINFVGSPLYNIRGRVADRNGMGISGVNLFVNGPMSRSATSDVNGNYSLNDLPTGGNYLVTLSKGGYVFEPPERRFDNLSGDQTVNFTALPSLQVEVRITNLRGAGIEGISIVASGSFTATPTVSYSGTYIFQLPIGGNYILTPSSAGYTFSPAIQIINNLSSSQSLYFTVTSSPDGPLLLTTQNSNNALALDSATFTTGPFPVTSSRNFSPDQHTRVMFLAGNVTLLPGEDLSVLKVQAEDSRGNIYPLPVEAVANVPDFAWLTQIVVKLPDEITNAGIVRISLTLRGTVSNKTFITIAP